MKALMAMVGDNIDPWLPHTTKEDWEFEDSLLYFKHHLYIPEVAHHQLVQGAWGILLYPSLASEGLLVARNVCTPPKNLSQGVPCVSQPRSTPILQPVMFSSSSIFLDPYASPFDSSSLSLCFVTTLLSYPLCFTLTHLH